MASEHGVQPDKQRESEHGVQPDMQRQRVNSTFATEEGEHAAKPPDGSGAAAPPESSADSPGAGIAGDPDQRAHPSRSTERAACESAGAGDGASGKVARGGPAKGRSFGVCGR